MTGVSVGNNFRVNRSTIGDQDNPAVAVDAQGNYVVVWQRNNFANNQNSGGGIFAQRYDRFGNAIGAEIRVNTNPPSNAQRDPVIGMDANGNFVVAWTSSVGPGVWARRFNSAGNALGDQFSVSLRQGNIGPGDQAIAMNDNGQFVITWERSGIGRTRSEIIAQVYDRAGNEVGNNIAVAAGNAIEPAVGIDGSGNFTVTWTSRNSGQVQTRRFNRNGAAIGNPRTVSTLAPDTNQTQTDPVIAMNANGDAVVVWADEDADELGIYAQRYDSTGAAVGDVITVSTNIVSFQDAPSVMIDADGNFFVAWQSFRQDGNRGGVYGQYFDNTGARQGEEFRINSSTEGNQDAVALGMDANGNAIAVWSSRDGDDVDVFGQQFAARSIVEFSQATYVINEDGTVAGAEVTITRVNDLLASDVEIAVSGGSATAGSDYTNNFPLRVTFARGESTKTITIPILDDTLVEGSETLELTLTATRNARTGTQRSTTVTIADNDGLTLVGTPNNDTLEGSVGDDIIRGLGGNDRIRGLDGNDRLIGGGGNDRLVGGEDDDILRGGGGKDRLIGNAGNDTLTGNGGDDVLKGGAGNDVLRGARGDDKLIGGRGNDIFVLKKRHGSDFIRDFQSGDDRIRLQGSLSFRDLSFERKGNQTLIISDGEELARLRGIQPDQFSQADFV